MPTPGLHAVIAIHSTALGPALGGVRFWHYDNRHRRARRRAAPLRGDDRSRRRSPGSTRAAARRSCSGTSPTGRARPSCSRALGRAIDELGGRYLAAEDVGATTADMNALGARDAVGHRRRRGARRLGRSVAGHRVRRASRRCARRAAELDGEPSLRGRRVVVQGAGHVGAPSGAPARGRRRATSSSPTSTRARADAAGAASSASTTVAADVALEHGVRHPRAVRARSACSTTRRSRDCAVAPSSARRTTSSPGTALGSRARRHAGSSTRPTSW